LLCVSLHGCGRPSTGFQSGSRLHAHVWDGGDRARQLIAFHDRQLNVACMPARAEDGAIRCLPTQRAEVAFLDAACTVPVALAYASTCGGPKPKYAASTPQGSGCAVEDASTLYAVGDVLTPATIYRKDSTCHPQPPTGGVVYAVTHLDPATFVGMTETQVSHGAVGAKVYVGDDGSRLTRSLYDTGRGAPCRTVELPSGTRCISGEIVDDYVFEFADAQCSTPVTFLYQMSCVAPGYVLSHVGWNRGPTGCDTISLHLLGDPVDKSSVSESFPGAPELCTRTTSLGPFYRFGADVPVEPFPTLKKSFVGAGAVTLPVWATADGESLELPADGLTDRARNVGCNIATGADGRLRCAGVDLPGVYPGGESFEDPACTREIVQVGAICNVPPPTMGLRWAQSQACGASTIASTFALGAKVTPSMVYSKSSGTCKGSPPSMFELVSYYEVGAPGDLSTLPVVVEIDE